MGCAVFGVGKGSGMGTVVGWCDARDRELDGVECDWEALRLSDPNSFAARDDDAPDILGSIVAR